VVDPARDHHLSVDLHHFSQQRRHDDPPVVVKLEELTVIDALDQLEHGRFHRGFAEQSFLDNLPHRHWIDAQFVGEKGAHKNLTAIVPLELLAQLGRELDSPLGVDGCWETAPETFHPAPSVTRSDRAQNEFSTSDLIGPLLTTL
jgi:hypothetical protein